MTLQHTILTVDDEPDVVKSLQDLLRLDYRVLGTTKPSEVLPILRSEPVQVVITDQRMPEMNGIELLRSVRLEHPEVMRLLLTGFADLPALIDAVNIGNIFRYISKPWNADDLQTAIRDACDHFDRNAKDKTARAAVATPSPTPSRADELGTLCHIVTQASRQNLNGVLQLIGKAVTKVFKVQACSIHLLNEDKSMLTVRSTINLSRKNLTARTLQVSQSKTDQEAIRTGHSCFVNDPAKDPVLFSQFASPVAGILCTPILYGDTPEGVIHVYTDKAQPFTSCDIMLLDAIASELAGVIVRARRHRAAVENAEMKRSLTMAAEVQRRMIPMRTPTIAGFDLGAVWLARETLGGDFYDFIPLTPPNVGIAICDVMGKGTRASLMMSAIRASLRAHAIDTPDMGGVLRRINQDLLEFTSGAEFATLFYGMLDPVSRRLVYCNAGHCPPLLFRHGERQTLASGGPVLGLNREANFWINSLPLEAGDVLLAYTDGLSEAMNARDEMFGTDRICEAIRAAMERGHDAQGIVQEVLAEMKRFAGTKPRWDDVTVIAIKVLPSPAGDSPSPEKPKEAGRVRLVPARLDGVS